MNETSETPAALVAEQNESQADQELRQPGEAEQNSVETQQKVEAMIASAKQISVDMKAELRKIGLDADNLFVDAVSLTKLKHLAKLNADLSKLASQRDDVGRENFPNNIRRFFHDATGFQGLGLVPTLLANPLMRRKVLIEQLKDNPKNNSIHPIHKLFLGLRDRIDDSPVEAEVMADWGLIEAYIKYDLTLLSGVIYGANIDGEPLPQTTTLANLAENLDNLIELHNQVELTKKGGAELIINFERNLDPTLAAEQVGLIPTKAFALLKNLGSNSSKAYVNDRADLSASDAPKEMSVKLSSAQSEDGTNRIELRVDDSAGGFDSGFSGDAEDWGDEKFQPVDLVLVEGGYRGPNGEVLAVESHNEGLRQQMEHLAKDLNGDYRVGTRYNKSGEGVGASIVVTFPVIASTN